MSDLVVRGRVTGDQLGRTVTGPGVERQFILARVAVNEVFKGIPETRTSGMIDIEWSLRDATDLEMLSLRIPEHDTLFFLFNQGKIAELTLHPEDVERYRYQYTLINDDQGALRDINGRVRPVTTGIPTWFPEEYDGGPFETLLQDVRDSVRASAR